MMKPTHPPMAGALTWRALITLLISNLRCLLFLRMIMYSQKLNFVFAKQLYALAMFLLLTRLMASP